MLFRMNQVKLEMLLTVFIYFSFTSSKTCPKSGILTHLPFIGYFSPVCIRAVSTAGGCTK